MADAAPQLLVVQLQRRQKYHKPHRANIWRNSSPSHPQIRRCPAFVSFSGSTSPDPLRHPPPPTPQHPPLHRQHHHAQHQTRFEPARCGGQHPIPPCRARRKIPLHFGRAALSGVPPAQPLPSPRLLRSVQTRLWILPAKQMLLSFYRRRLPFDLSSALGRLSALANRCRSHRLVRPRLRANVCQRTTHTKSVVFGPTSEPNQLLS